MPEKAHRRKPDAQDYRDDPSVWRRWFYSANHENMGTLCLIFAFAAGFIGGAFSLALRLELQELGLQFFSNAQAFNVFVMGHELIMVFFVIMPALIGGFGIWCVPLMIGAPAMPSPRRHNDSLSRLRSGGRPGRGTEHWSLDSPHPYGSPTNRRHSATSPEVAAVAA
jgi:cytochrome c oxidase subunit I